MEGKMKMMSARPMLKGVNRIARFAAVSALALGGIAVSAGSASASTVTVCRGAASVPVGVHLDSCYVLSSSGLSAQIGISVDPGGTPAFPCAQLWRVNGNGTESFVHDYGCPGNWYGPGTSLRWTSNPYLPPSGSTYVVRVGYWDTLDGTYGYYGDVESPSLYWS